MEIILATGLGLIGVMTPIYFFIQKMDRGLSDKLHSLEVNLSNRLTALEVKVHSQNGFQ